MRRGLGFKPLRQMEGNLFRVSCGVSSQKEDQYQIFSPLHNNKILFRGSFEKLTNVMFYETELQVSENFK